MEVASFPKGTKEIIGNFIKNDIVYQYGQPEVIMSDNAKNINNEKEFCGKFNIKHLNSVIYRLMMNDVMEAASKNIKKIMKKMLTNH